MTVSGLFELGEMVGGYGLHCTGSSEDCWEGGREGVDQREVRESFFLEVRK